MLHRKLLPVVAAEAQEEVLAHQALEAGSNLYQSFPSLTLLAQALLKLKEKIFVRAARLQNEIAPEQLLF